MSKKILWLVALAVTVPYFIKSHFDEGTRNRYRLETNAVEACRERVREKSERPDDVSFKIGTRQRADAATQISIVEGRVSMTDIAGVSKIYSYHCRYDGKSEMAVLEKLDVDDAPLIDKINKKRRE